jgi:hypothetical protein
MNKDSKRNVYYTESSGSSTSSVLHSYNHLQAVVFDARRELVYAAFTRTEEEKNSAVCVYDKAALEAAFNGPFLHQRRKDAAWEVYRPVEGEEYYKCSSSSSSSSSNSKLIIDSRRFQLKLNAVQPVHRSGAVIVTSDEAHKILHLAVDSSLSALTSRVNAANSHVDVLFAATAANTLLKYTIVGLSNNACLLEEMQIIDDEQNNRINNMKLLDDQSVLLVATSDRVIRVPTTATACHAHTNYFACLAHADPYCVWESRSQRCTLIHSAILLLNSTTSASSSYHQNVLSSTSCANANTMHMMRPVDGGLGEWTAWTSCSTRISSSNSNESAAEVIVAECKCRTRQCNRPAPRNGGRGCDESQAMIEIAECSVSGAWSPWSQWSACQFKSPAQQRSTCDLLNSNNAKQQQTTTAAVRVRTRTCTVCLFLFPFFLFKF